MHIAEANTRTTLRTSLSPPAAYKRAVEMSCICFGCIVAVAYKVAVAVVVAAATASACWLYEVVVQRYIKKESKVRFSLFLFKNSPFFFLPFAENDLLLQYKP
jgi:hypothetical protein